MSYEFVVRECACANKVHRWIWQTGRQREGRGVRTVSKQSLRLGSYTHICMKEHV